MNLSANLNTPVTSSCNDLEKFMTVTYWVKRTAAKTRQFFIEELRNRIAKLIFQIL